MDLRLKGKRALVTGSSSGIGEAIAKALAAEGASVIVHGRREAEARRVAEEITAAGGHATVALGDLGTDEGADAVVAAVQKALGGVDILVNNAGAFPMLDWERGTPKDWSDLYNTNVVSMVRVIQRVLPGMKAAKWGRLIQIASAVGPQPEGGMPVYSATKAANINQTVSLAKALAGTGITANAVSPGPILTQGFKDLFAPIVKQQGWGEDWAEIEPKLQETMIHSPVGRLGRPEDIAHMVAFLASPLADYITGANMRVDGGYVTSGN